MSVLVVASYAVSAGTMYHSPRFCSNESAPSNIWLMLKTDETSQEEMVPLKLEALANMPNMSVTREVFQMSRSWLKVEALANMRPILVTDETFQPEMSPLKSSALSNMLDM